MGRLILIVVLLLLLVGMLPTWGYSQGWGMGYYPSGGVGLILLIVVLALLFGKGRGTHV